MKESNHQFGNLRVMAFKGEVAAWNKVYLGIWLVAFESIGSCWNERWIVLTPYGQQRWLIGTEVLLKLRIESHIAAIVENEVILHLGAAWMANIIVIE